MISRDDGNIIAVAGVTTENDALLAAALGASVIIFDFYPSPYSVTTTAAHDIIRRLPSGVSVVGAFRTESPERVCDISARLGLHGVELRGGFSGAAILYIATRVSEVWRAVPSTHIRDAVAPQIAAIVVPEEDDFEAWQRATDVWPLEGLSHPFLVAGMTADTVADVIARHAPRGVIAKEGIARVGSEFDPADLARFLRAAKSAFDEPWF